jgi:hypothetical protein
VKVGVEGGKKVVETINDGNTATIKVDQILTGIGRVPAVDGLDLEAAGVAFDANSGVQVDDFLRTTNRRILRGRRRLPRTPLHRYRRRVGTHRGAERTLPRPQASQPLDDSVVHLHRPGGRRTWEST